MYFCVLQMFQSLIQNKLTFVQTINERHMWLHDVSDPSNISLEVLLSLSPTVPQISRIKIWNYNKSTKESAKGVRECEVFVNRTSVWKGAIERGCGNQVFDFSTSINISKNAIPSDSSAEDEGIISDRALELIAEVRHHLVRFIT